MNTIFQRIKNFIKRGITVSFGKYRIQLILSKIPASASLPPGIADMLIRQIHYLEKTIPEIREFSGHVTSETAQQILEFYFALLPALHSEAKEAYFRSVCGKLARITKDEALRQKLVNSIAASDLRCGIPDRATILKKNKVLRSELQIQTDQLEKAYGARLISEDWANADRGLSLKYYLENHSHLLTKKRILHFSPERTLEAWLRQNTGTYDFDYITSNISGSDVDKNLDITRINLPDDSFDLIICHRVLEHVLDDISAMQELYRILKPHGVLNVSVPQAMHKKTTYEWIYPDLTHHDHVRHYGSDFSAKLQKQGFKVNAITWLLKKDRQDLLSRQAYPMRFYNAEKRPQKA